MFRIVAALALLFASLPALAGEVAKVVALRGDAIVTQSGRASKLAVGAAIEEGAVIRTGTPGRVKLKFIDGSVVVIGDASSFKVDNMSLDEEGRRREAGFVLDIGLISQSVAPARDGSWAVRTPTAVTAVRGTEYVVEVRPDLATEVNIRSGEVVVEPVQQPGKRGARMRSIRTFDATAEGRASVVLGHEKLGTSCSLEGICEPAKMWGDARLKAVQDRLSGV